MEITEARMFDRGPFNFEAQNHYNRRWNNVKRRRKVANDHRFRADSALSEARGQNLIPTAPLMHLMKYGVPLVLGVGALKYQSKPDILFRGNPIPVWCFITATCVYWVAVEKMEQMTTVVGKCFQKLRNAALASGVLSVLSLLSIFLPYPFSLVPLIVWVPLAAVLMWPILKYVYSFFNIGITSVIKKIYAILVWARGLKSKEEASNLPV